MNAVAAALAAARAVSGGAVTGVYPSLAATDPDLLAAALHRLGEAADVGGDAAHPFILMSAAKPFVLALAVDLHGEDRVLSLTGMRETGLPFNDVRAIHAGPGGRTNPMVNPGAITASSLLGEDDAGAGEARLRAGLSAFAGRDLVADAAMVEAIHATNHRNRELAGALAARRLLGTAVEDALHLYTLQSCLAVTVADLARMGAVLAAGGVDPVTGVRVVSPAAARVAVEAMALAGLYEGTAAWRGAVGLPAKSGIAGGMVMVAPGRGSAAAFSPPLDATGNPLRAQVALTALAPALTRP
ncbi:glutaminase [Demequina sp. SYSU T00068]|uniref:glutaminase n=1 Tax=Demequina lignilytica TaxID=3051663 RepID=UPI002634B176|nr:glutaminase [Demequina sp. SYSU T00068]MDN4489316.1 glutaminase [Demequina sp. SYSU T00068]